MCGIIGAIATRAPARPPSPSFGEVVDALAHRGPDGRGELREGNVLLGHRRLSIIDLSTAADQPMTADGCGAVVFNGEIYDHATHRAWLASRGEVFRTRSDTEVLLRGLARDGVDFLKRLHGMYAFAWLTPDRRRLVLARDHAGMKPLYLWRGPEGVAFSSEVRALAALVRALGGTARPSGAALAGFLAWGSVPEPGCVLEGATVLPPDHAAEIDVDEPSRVVIRPVGRRPSRAAALGEAAVPGVAPALRDAVARHLVADRPVALFLSGGVDSGVLAAEMARGETVPPHAISVVLQSLGTEDEPAVVRRLATRLGLPLHMVPVDDWHARLAGVLGVFDQPSVDGLNTFVIAGVARELGYRVALSGVGADEVFGGYAHLHSPLARVPPSRAPGGAAGPVFERAGAWLAARRDVRVRRVGILLEGFAHHEPAQRSWRRVFPDSQIRALLPDVAPAAPSPAERDPLELEQRTYLVDTLLRDTDVMGMAHGVEIRAPYLDPAVLEAAARVGTATLLRRDKAPKWVLREGWADALDPRSLARRKTGFTLDVAGWLRSAGAPVLDAAREGLLGRSAVDGRALDALWSRWTARLDTGHPAAWAPLFALVQLEEQFRRLGEPA